MKTIRWGIIGCGDVTEVKSGPALQKAEGSALVAVMRRDAGKAADYAKRHNVARSYGDAGALINDPDVDAVYIATPPSSHIDYVKRVAAAGKPAYVEKPMGRTYADCVEMINVCKSAGVPLFVAYYRRRLPKFLRVETLLKEGAVGDVRFVNLTLFQRPHANESDRNNLHWHVVPAIAGSGRFMDLASHELDILNYLLGDITEATGSAANQGKLYEAEDIVRGQWQHPSGVVGTGVWSFTSFDRIDRIEIVGNKGMITFSCFGTEPVVLTTATGSKEFAEPTPPHIQQPLIQTIVDELRGHGKCPSTGITGAHANWVMDQMLADWRAKTGQPGPAAHP